MPKSTTPGGTRSERFQVSVTKETADLLDKLAETTGQPRYVCASLALSMGAKLLLETFSAEVKVQLPAELAPAPPIASPEPSKAPLLRPKTRGKR